MPERTGKTIVAQSKKHVRPELQRQHGKLSGIQQRAMLANTRADSKLPRMPWQQMRTQRRAGAFIADQPEGRYQLYERNGQSYFATYYGVYDNDAVGKICEAVFTDDGKVYLKYIISQVSCPGWIEGTVNGSKLSFTFPQIVYPLNGDNFYVMDMTYDEAEQTYYGITQETTVTMDYDPATGRISLTNGVYATGEHIIGLTDEDGYWVGFGDWNFTMTPVDIEPQSAPEDLVTEQYVVKADGFGGTIANVGFSGNDIYVQGIYPGLPEAWVKGTIKGDKAVFASGQYLGPDYDNVSLQFLISATAETTHVEDPYWGDYDETVYFVSDDDIVFDYDAATRTLTGGSLFMVNAGLTNVSYAVCYENCDIKPFVEVAATPMAPIDVAFSDLGYYYWNIGYGWGYIDITLASNDEDGNYILQDKLSYAVWVRVNGQESQLTLHAYDYVNLSEDMDELPYSFTDNWDIYAFNDLREIFLFVTGFEAVGVQTIYRGAGEERRSEIIWADVWGSDVQPDAATPEYPEVDPDDVGGSIDYGSYTGNESRVTFGEWKPQTYDVAMKLENELLVGTYIEDITFNLRTIDGLSNLKVWLSSQLRVEDGQNAPDLVSIDVDMPTKTGDVTVTLPKPYIIPEGGVFVGYSFDVAPSAYSSRYLPISVVNEVKPSGLYIHSTGCFLKWVELSEMSGCSSCINVTLGGSKVMANAADVSNGEPVYLTAGQSGSVNINFVNSGSEGIKSLDVEYTFNGLTQKQHITPASPVKGFFGTVFAYTLNMPAVNNPGTYPLTVKVVKVNDADNEIDNAEGVTDIIVVSSIPKHRALLEEYTGTWCGWCPRGFVALELLKEMYPDDFVTVSYHNGDPMEITEFFPSEVSGFPTAWVDRGMEVDPFYGIAEEGFGVVDVLQWRSSMFGLADIDVEATLADDESTVDVTANVSFPFSSDNVDLSLEYILVEDGMTGEGNDWKQSNYYAGQAGFEEEMDEFINAGSSVEGLVFNDVAVMQSEMGGIWESIPTEVTDGVPVSHSYSFDLEWAINTAWEPIIQDYSKLFVVAMLIDNQTGEVRNAVKVPVKTAAATGIERAASDSRTVSSVERFDLSGRRVSAAAKGVGIVRVNHSDGSSRVVKVMK